jgi:hypothetical protein
MMFEKPLLGHLKHFTLSSFLKDGPEHQLSMAHMERLSSK